MSRPQLTDEEWRRVSQIAEIIDAFWPDDEAMRGALQASDMNLEGLTQVDIRHASMFVRWRRLHAEEGTNDNPIPIN